MVDSVSARSIASALAGVQVGEAEWKCRCPAHDDSSPSLWVRDSDDGKILVHCFVGCAQDRVIEALKMRQLWPAGRSGGADRGQKLPAGISPVWPVSAIIKKQGLVPGPENQKFYTRLYRYRNSVGETVGYVVRYEGHGKKDHIPYFKHEGGRWRSGHARKTDRHLYGLELIERANCEEDAVTLVIVEGEKCADFINALGMGVSGMFAMTWPGGARSALKVDWSPVVDWGRIILAPDNDVPGYKAMADVAEALVGGGFDGELLLFRPEGDLPEGYDVADMARDDAFRIAGLSLPTTDAAALRGLARKLFSKAKNSEPIPPSNDAPDAPPLDEGSGDAPIIASSGGFEHSDHGNGKRMMLQFGTEILYTPDAGWFRWVGNRWHRDEANQVLALAGETARSIVADARECPDPKERRKILKFAQASCNMPRMKAMVDAAKLDSFCNYSEFDSDPWMLNCENGLVDLRTSELKPHDRSVRCTKMVAAPFLPDTPCPRWEKFLLEIMDGDKEMVDFLRRSVGYSLTGQVSEQVLFLLWGAEGSNGKSVFCETIKDIIGGYALQTESSLVTLKRNGESTPSNLVARLKGARMVIGNEMAPGAVLDDARVKELTGADTLSARFLYREAFEFKMIGKLWLRTNHRPSVRGSEVALWRRMLTIPFRHKIEEGKINKNLQAELHEERAGILSWAVAGCLEWQRVGLCVPQKIKHETKTYRDDMDVLGDWISECCDADSDGSMSSAAAYGSYRHWCQMNGERCKTQKALGIALRDRGFMRKRTSETRHYVGLTLKKEVLAESGSWSGQMNLGEDA